jgi:hypothetical protein
LFKSALIVTLFAFATLPETSARAEEANLVSFSLESAGVRYGLPANNVARGLQQGEMFSNYYLPWAWVFGRFEVQSRLDPSLGWIGGHSQNAFVGTVGPSLQLKRRNFPIELDFGSSPTYVSTHEWGTVDVGTQLQFSSHAGLDWDITRRLRVGYRFTHMSNAGIKEPNPGINMHMLSVSVLF